MASLRIHLRRTLGTSWFTPHKFTPRRCLNTSHTTFSVLDARLGRTQPNAVNEGDVQHSDLIRSVSSEHKIFLPNLLRRLKGASPRPNPCSLAIELSDEHCFSKNALKYLDKFEHPFAKSIVNIHIAQKQRPLWFTAYSPPVALPFPCRVANRRLRHAFRDALAARGYDRDGRRVAADDSSVIAELYGSLRIICGNPKAVCNIKFADLVEQVKQMVSRIEPVLARDKEGRHIGAIQRPEQSKSKPPQWPKKPFNRNTKTRSRTDAR
ncbi:hypothetical protein GGS26DRAFT_418811 [Hypomontagnella submonticulosa]|nr:hypothetical protein GGS26DRAFT_418811 [Hypomontagnella submonticulosa]